jgi:hypothetical protein
MAAGKAFVIPWLLHVVILGVVGGAIVFFAPFLIPALTRPFATFVGISTILFPLCRRRWILFAANYVVAAVAAAVLFFR